jgi:hydroxyacyl-ACP dehydratase HTD2-like protein with hotdog domain
VEGYPGLLVQGSLMAVLPIELVRCHTYPPVTIFTFCVQVPLFGLASFRLMGTPGGDRVHREAQGTDGATTLAATTDWPMWHRQPGMAPALLSR